VRDTIRSKERQSGMKAKRWFALAVVLATGVTLAQAQLVNGRFLTSVYAWRQFDTVGSSTNFVRAFQTVQLSIAQGEFSLQTYLQGAAGGTNGAGQVRFYNLYFTWSNIARMVDLSLGRQAVYAGVANGSIDGLRASARFWQDKIRVTGFAGATVADEFKGIRKNIHDNLSLGGQVVTTALPDFRIGISYLNRREERDPYMALRVRDTTYEPSLYSIGNDSPAEEYGSADVTYTSWALFSVYGRYDYDFNLSRTSRGQVGTRVNVTNALALTADYIYRAPHVMYNSIFSVFPQNNVSEVEGGIEYAVTSTLRTFGKYAYVSYPADNDIVRDKNHRWTLGVNSVYGSFSYAGSDGYAGQLQSLSLQGSYPLLNRLVTPSLGVSYASYRLSSDAPRDNALAVLLGATVRPVNAFSFDVQGQWMTNRIYGHDMRLQVRLMYWFAERLSIIRQEVAQ
jgi:hypothetical protein